MRFAICDDNSSDLKTMREVFHRVAPEHALDTFSDGRQLLDAVSGGANYDLLFLDILMPQITGMELAREISRLAPGIPVVFLTDSESYAVEAFSVRALHYILKPMTEEALKELKETAEEEKYFPKMESLYNQLQEQITKDKENDLITYKKEISEYLASEIVVRYYHQKGRIANQLSIDPDIKVAKEILNDLPRYRSILKIK